MAQSKSKLMNSPPMSVTQVDDFGNYFPDVDLSPPSRSMNGFAIVVYSLV